MLNPNTCPPGSNDQWVDDPTYRWHKIRCEGDLCNKEPFKNDVMTSCINLKGQSACIFKNVCYSNLHFRKILEKEQFWHQLIQRPELLGLYF